MPPLNPALILGIDNTAPKIPDPIDQYVKGVHLKALLGQGELQDLQTQQARKAIEEDAATGEAYKEAGGDINRLRTILQGRGLHKQDQGVAKFQLETEEKRGTIDKHKGEILDAALKRNREQLSAVNDPQAAAQWISSIFADPVLGPHAKRYGTMEESLARLQAASKDPASFQQWKIQSGLGIEKAMEMQKPDYKPVAAGGSTVFRQMNAYGPGFDASAVPHTQSPDSIATGQRPHYDQARGGFVTPPAAPGAPAPAAAPSGAIPPAFIAAITGVESSGNPDAVGPVNRNGQRAMGSMQIMPDTFKQYARPGQDDYNNDEHRKAAALRKIQDDFAFYGGDLRKVAAAYIGGRGAVLPDGTIRADVKDVNGTTPVAYADMVLKRVGGAQPSPAAATPAPAAAPTAAPGSFVPVLGPDGKPVGQPPKWGAPKEITGPDGKPMLAVQNETTGAMHDANTLQPLPQGFGPKLGETAEKQRTGVANVRNAITEYQTALKDWKATDIALPDSRARMGTIYNNALLQAKEAFNLGVLNGPDYMILQQVLTNPATLKGGITSNAALMDQAKKLDEIMGKIGTTITQTQSGVAPDGMAVPRGTPPKRPTLGEVKQGYIYKGGDPAKPASWEKASS